MAALRRTFRVLGWGLAGLLVVVFLVGYAAPYLPPRAFWWTGLVAVFLPATSLGVGAFGVGLCLWGIVRRRWGELGLGAALIVLILLRFGPRLAAWGPAPPPGESLRLMTFNVPPRWSRSQVSEGPTSLAGLVRHEAPHVLALQELRLETGAGTSGQTERMSPSVRALLAPPAGYTLPRWLPATTLIQQPVLGRLPLDSMSVHPLPPDGKTRARSRYTRTLFAWQGRPAVLYNVHLHSIGRARPWTLMPAEWTSLARWRTFLQSYREGALRRAQQARLIRRRIERESRPVLVAGDFNSTPHQWAYRHLAQGLQSAVTRRMRGRGSTFPARRPLVQIDHVLAGPAWQVTAAQIPAAGAGVVSDHRPVVVQLRWKRQ